MCSFRAWGQLCPSNQSCSKIPRSRIPAIQVVAHYHRFCPTSASLQTSQRLEWRCAWAPAAVLLPVLGATPSGKLGLCPVAAW